MYVTSKSLLSFWLYSLHSWENVYIGAKDGGYAGDEISESAVAVIHTRGGGEWRGGASRAECRVMIMMSKTDCSVSCHCCLCSLRDSVHCYQDRAWRSSLAPLCHGAVIITAWHRLHALSLGHLGTHVTHAHTHTHVLQPPVQPSVPVVSSCRLHVQLEVASTHKGAMTYPRRQCFAAVHAWKTRRSATASTARKWRRKTRCR